MELPKFRIRAKDEKKMYDVVSIKRQNWKLYWNWTIEIDNENYILMQYTGLKDKNWKEIYEWDILYNEVFTHNLWYVKYSSEKGAFIIYNKKFWEVWYLTNYSELEIVGNIYENKELLDRNTRE